MPEKSWNPFTRLGRPFQGDIMRWGKFVGLGKSVGLHLPLLLLCLLPLFAFSQSKKDLEDKRKRILREIETTNKLIKKTAKIKEATLDRYLAVQNQIERREDLIQTINDELAATEFSAARTADVIASLSRDLKMQQEEYARMMRSALRRKLTTNPLVFIFSAESLNQMFRRWMFMRKYNQFRREQAVAIDFTKKMLAKKMLALEESRREKAQLLDAIEGQKQTLTSDLTHKKSLLETLKKDEKQLKVNLKQQETEHENLNQAIEKAIQEEVRKRTEEARRAAAAKPKPKPENPSQPGVTDRPPPPTPSTDADDPLSAEFAKNRGRLPWPVDHGFISKKFGRQPHPTIPNIEITNNGIDIRTEELQQVFAIFDGKVVSVQFIPGHDYMMILQHGDYYTVYSNLQETYAAKGEQVKAKKSLGTVSTNAITGSSELHFELWREKERLNPAQWIKH